MTEEGNKRYSVFISHKHQDKKFADIVRRFVETFGAAQDLQVYQSSDPLGRGPGSGRVLTHELRDAIARSNLFILVFTYPDLDWDFCMMELGMALDPSTPQTRVMVLKCARRPVLETLAGLKYTDVTQVDDVIRFAQDMLSDPESFPNINQPLTLLSRTDERVLTAGRALFENFDSVTKPDVIDGEWAGFPFLQLQLPLDTVKKIKEGGDKPSVSRLLEQLILSGGSGLAEVFGRYEAQGSVSDLLPTDRFETLRDYFAQLVIRTAQGDIPDPVGPTIGTGGDARVPVLARFRRVASRDCMEYEVFLLRGQTFSVSEGEQP